MFREWGFLLGEIWVLLALAALVGLIAGWSIWGRRSGVTIDTGEADGLRDGLRGDLAGCQSELKRYQAAAAVQNGRISELESDLGACQAARISQEELAAPVGDTGFDFDGDINGDIDGDGIVEGTDEGVKPATLDAPRDGGADDLKRISGIGPKMEALCNRLGFWHFDQIAGWSGDEVAWVDANLEGFKGRVTRDEWVAQARLLASGGETEFSKKVDGGGVY
jgi:hypothetical protein